MATIRQITSGYWQGIIRKKGFEQQSKTFEFKRDCEKWVTDTEALMNRGIFNDLSEAESLSIADGLKRYLQEVTPRKKGFAMEIIRINVLLRHKLSNKTFATFKKADAASFRDELLKTKSPSTANKELSIISHLFETAAKEWGVHCINPVKQISKPKIRNSRERRLSDIEFKYLMLALKDESGGSRTNIAVVDIVVFAIETAMRQAEILSLTWADIDIQKRVATLHDTKNGNSRAVPLSSKAISVLTDTGKIARLKRGKVFDTTASALKQSYRRAVVRARRYYLVESGDEADEAVLIDLTFHDLRHEATSRLANIFALHELMKITGHSDAKMLARYYHPRAEDLAKRLA